MFDNKFWDSEKEELNDTKIIKALKQVVEDYENGELFEVMDVCQQIANAIHTFDDVMERNGG